MSFPRGSILLTSILILAAILLSVTLAISQSLVEQSAQKSAHENSDVAEALANACVEYGINAVVANAAYAGNETVVVGTTSCSVLPVQINGGSYIVTGRATVSTQTVTMTATLSSRTPPTVSSWREVP